MEQVRLDNLAKIFNFDLDRQLEQTVPSKEQWVNQFKVANFSIKQQAKYDAKSGSRLIYKCWDQRKPELQYKKANLCDNGW